MAINPSIFKSYDVRGIYPTELNEESAYAIGRAFIRKTGSKQTVIGYDARLSSLALMKAFAQGVMDECGKVYDIGQTPTECVYFAVGSYEYDSGVMVTASHNPKEYNGFKMLVRRPVRQSLGDGGSLGEGGMIEMVRGKDLLESSQETAKENYLPAEKEFFKKDVWKDYFTHVLSFVDLSEIAPLKIVVDASNGVAGKAISQISDKLPVEIIPLNFDPDGNFPNHSPNPLEEGSSDKISQIVKDQKADFGVMFDGDADRLFLVDEQGRLVRADAVLLLLAKYFLDKNPGMAVAYNAICSKAVPEFIQKWGGVPVRTQVGFVNVREGMLKNSGIMGGELSGHYCFKDNFYMDSGMVAFLSLLQIFSKYPSADGSGQIKVSEIISELSPYVKSPELNFKVENKEAILEKVKEKYADGQQDFLDGITVTYKDWWLNVRASNTEPVLRLTIEADTKEILDKKQKELVKLISN